MSQFSDFVVYADESGDHNLSKYDPNFPVFVLTFCVFRKEEYIERIVPALQRMKFKHFGHDMAIFHEREIRKAEGPFAFLTDSVRRAEFMTDLNTWVEQSAFTIIGIIIRKAEFDAKYAGSQNPYHFAMRLGLERVDKFLRRRGQGGKTTHVIFESRGKKEDGDLSVEFDQVCAGCNYLSEAYAFQIAIVDKRVNSTGLQLADLTARPIGRHVINPDQPNRAFTLIEAKLDRGANGKIDGYGLKCFP